MHNYNPRRTMLRVVIVARPKFSRFNGKNHLKCMRLDRVTMMSISPSDCQMTMSTMRINRCRLKFLREFKKGGMNWYQIFSQM